MLSIVMLIRKLYPFYGLRKIWHEMQTEHNFKIGRDRLHGIMREHGLMLPRRYKVVQTTFPGTLPSSAQNKIKNLDINRKDQVWATDITFIRTYEGCIYLSVVMDLWSRFIVSYHVSYDLKAESSAQCLRKAIDTVKETEGIIHHSDKGVQYCSNLYLNQLTSAGMDVSFTGKGHCYDNARVERLFNTLKHEYGLANLLPNRKIAEGIIANIIRDYNYNRIHEALNYKKPGEVYNAL